MKQLKAVLLSTCLLLSMLPCVGKAADAGSATAQSQSASAHQFVQNFYDWYVPFANKEHKEASSTIAVRMKAKSFTPALIQALKEDDAAAAKSPEEIVGLDFDPFLNSQDLCEKYVLGRTTVDKNTASVEIYGVCSGKKDQQPAVIAELISTGAGWQFENFKYDKDDLLATLAALKRDRSATSKKGN